VGATTVTDDVALLAVVAGVIAVALLVVHLTVEAVRAAQPPRPSLPEEDCPPAGLGRLVPFGGQIDVECHRGVVALELWLASHRRGSGPSSAHVTLPRQAPQPRRRRAPRPG
jgi:hypothetical protein